MIVSAMVAQLLVHLLRSLHMVTNFLCGPHCAKKLEIRFRYAFVFAVVIGLTSACSRAPHSTPSVSKSASLNTDEARMRDLAVQHNANIDWITQIKSLTTDSDRILTADLQREWLNGSPIVFPGVLADAKLLSSGTYLLHIEAEDYFLLNDDQNVALQLECPASQVVALLQNRKGLANPYAYRPTLLVVAQITRVYSRRFLEADQENVAEENSPSGSGTISSTHAKDWKIGFGSCLHIESINSRTGKEN